MKYTREQIEEYIADDQRLAAAVGGNSSLSSAMLRQLLAERDALADALDSYISFVQDAHIVDGQFHWLPDGDCSQDIIDAALKPV